MLYGTVATRLYYFADIGDGQVQNKNKNFC